MTNRFVAELALKQLKGAVWQHLVDRPGENRNSEIAVALGLQSHHSGSQRDYLTYSVLGLLMDEGRVVTEKINNVRYYHAVLADGGVAGSR
jgi:hypothetical protein